MQMRESEHAIHEQNNQTIRGNRGNRSNRSNPDRIRDNRNHLIIREIRRIISRGARTTKTSGNDSRVIKIEIRAATRRRASLASRGLLVAALRKIGLSGRY
jgi:hypothetical protein